MSLNRHEKKSEDSGWGSPIFKSEEEKNTSKCRKRAASEAGEQRQNGILGAK